MNSATQKAKSFLYSKIHLKSAHIIKFGIPEKSHTLYLFAVVELMTQMFISPEKDFTDI